MNYEQKYKEALNRAKSVYGENPVDSERSKACQIIFPELRESEDERIRKEILDYIKVNYHWANKEELEQRRRFLAYLEKQKEPVVNKEGMYYYLGGKFIYCGYPATEENPYDFAMNQQKEQKPAEWSEEDDQLIGFIFDLLNDLVWRKDWAMSKEECLERLKSLRPSWKPSEEQICVLCDAISALKHFGYKPVEIVESLCEQLKKLI